MDHRRASKYNYRESISPIALQNTDLEKDQSFDRIFPKNFFIFKKQFLFRNPKKIHSKKT